MQSGSREETSNTPGSAHSTINELPSLAPRRGWAAVGGGGGYGSDGGEGDGGGVRPLQHRNPFGPQMPRSGMWKKGESLGTGAFGSVFLGLNCETGAYARLGSYSERLARRELR